MDLDFSTPLPEKVYAEVVVRSATGKSVLNTNTPVTSRNITDFYADAETLQRAAQRLMNSGFEVLDIGNLSISIAAAPEVYQQTFNSLLEAVERPVIKELGLQTTAAFLNAIDPAPFGQISPNRSDFRDILAGVVLNEPLYYLQSKPPSATPPITAERYLSVPDDLAQSLNATAVHQRGITGKGVHVVMVDSGWYCHPFFEAHRYNVQVRLAPGSADVTCDESGHGTGESANLLAIAPGVSLTIVKADIAITSKMRNINSIAALRTAAALKPDIISCSWGSDQRSPILSPYNRLLAATVADLTRQNIIVVFAAGNGQWGFPAQHPEAIAAGGSYLHLAGSLQGTLEASTYASSFHSPVYEGRKIPDVCGLVGQLPHGKYILLPVPPGCAIDRTLAIVQDGTQPIDGWAAFSGTSAAAPQVAGVCALMKQVNPQLSPAEAKRILQQTARDVVNGFSNPASSGALARDGPDLATGYGLVDAHAAIRAIEPAVPPQQGDRPPSLGSSMFLSGPISLPSPPTPQKTSPGEKPMSVLYPKLHKNFEKILNVLEDALATEIEKGTIEDLELAISESNFVPRTISNKATLALVKCLKELAIVHEELADASSSKDSNDKPPSKKAIEQIQKKHILVAKSLLKIRKHRELALLVLTAALNYADGAVSESAAEALGEAGLETTSSKLIEIAADGSQSSNLLATPIEIPGNQTVIATEIPGLGPRGGQLFQYGGNRYECTEKSGQIYTNCKCISST